MNRRTFLAHMASIPALAAAPWLSGCASPRPLEVGIIPWIGYEPLYLAREFNWLPAGVQLHDGKDARDTLTALYAGQIDAACLTLDETLHARAAGMPLTAVLVFDVSAGADVVLARPAIRKLADLAGKRLGVEQNAVGALVLGKLLEAAGLPASALTLIDLPVGQQLAAWQNGELDAVITYEPTATRLLHKGAQRLFDSRQMPDTIFDVLAVHSDRAKNQRAALDALVAAHFRSLAHLQTNRQDAIYRIASHQNVSPNDVRQALAGVMLPSLAANHEYLATHDGRLIRAAKNLSAMMVQQGQLKREDTLDGLISASWLPHNEG